MQRLLLILVLLGTLASCKNEMKADWYAFTLEAPGMPGTDQIVLVHIDEKKDEYILHWLFYSEGEVYGELHKMFARLTSAGRRDTEENRINFSPYFELHNEIKSLHNKPHPFPMGRAVVFRFDLEYELLKLERAVINRIPNKIEAEVNQLIQEHKNWEGETVDLHFDSVF